jgi:flagellar biogenesis protein FliO
MVKALQSWFARQPLTVKLLVVAPVLALAVLWSVIPDDSAVPPAGVAPGNQPVLTSGTPATGSVLTPHEEPRAAQNGLTWVSALRTIVSVGVVLALIVVSARGLKHFMANAGQLPGEGAGLKVLETTYLPSPNGRGRAAIHLVETADGKQMLVGATDTTLSLLAELEDSRPRFPIRVGDIVEAEPATPIAVEEPAQSAFAELLAAASEKSPRGGTADSELSQRLKRLRESTHRLEETG